jgi:hypothetical protein
MLQRVGERSHEGLGVSHISEAIRDCYSKHAGESP